MDELPPCCQKAANKFMELGIARAAAAAKAIRDHASGHKQSMEFSSGSDDDKGKGY